VNRNRNVFEPGMNLTSHTVNCYIS
jgi:hypothetical protein